MSVHLIPFTTMSPSNIHIEAVFTPHANVLFGGRLCNAGSTEIVQHVYK